MFIEQPVDAVVAVQDLVGFYEIIGAWCGRIAPHDGDPGDSCDSSKIHLKKDNNNNK